MNESKRESSKREQGEIRRVSEIKKKKNETERNDAKGKIRDLFKKIRNIKRTFHKRMGIIKDINAKYLTEAKEIKRWQEYTEELYKKY